MSDYDYKSGKDRIEEILNTDTKIQKAEIPTDEQFTFSNGYKGWVTAIFVDIRDSSEIFSLENKEHVSKMIRSFTSEVIEILRDSDQLREIGIRGDCVYAIYNSPKMLDVFNQFEMTVNINSFIKMLNVLLSNKGFNEIEVGIGISTAEELVVKAGRKSVGINNKVWIGDAVTKASNLSSLGSKEGKRRIVLSSSCHYNIISKYVEIYGEEVHSWFIEGNHDKYGDYYHSNVIKLVMDKWINNGMK